MDSIRMSNQASAVDAPTTALSHVERAWRRATDPRRCISHRALKNDNASRISEQVANLPSIARWHRWRLRGLVGFCYSILYPSSHRLG
jgi:hypothetical protein